MDPIDVIVIGSGHNGLIAGCYLGQHGLRCSVLEAGDAIGGMTTSGAFIPNAPNHVVNPCAIDIILMRASPIVEELGLESAGFHQIEVDPGYAYLDSSGASIAIWRDPRRTATEIERLSRADAATYLDLVRTLDHILDIAGPLMLANPTRPPIKALTSAAVIGARRRKELREAVDLFLSPPDHTLRTRFEHPAVRSLLASVLSAGGDLMSEATSPAFLILPYLHRYGWSRPAGGMQNLVTALTRRLASLGGAVTTSACVSEIAVRNGRATGVRLSNGQTIESRLGVVATCDPRTTLGELVPDGLLPPTVARRVKNIPTNADGTGDLKIDLALSGQIRPSHHEARRGDSLDLRIPTTTFGSLDDINRAYALAATGAVAETIPFWLVVPTAVDPTQAPTGQDSVYIWSGWVPVSPLGGAADFQRATESVLASAASHYDGIDATEIGRSVTTSADFVRKYRVAGGCLTHVDFSIYRSGPLRPAWGLGGYRTPVRGLYLSGAGTHPGGGVSGVPGRNAALTLLRDARKRGLPRPWRQ